MFHGYSRMSVAVAVCGVVLVFCGVVLADSEADLATTAGSSASVTVTVNITTDLLGGDSDTDSDTVAVAGTAMLTLAPTDPAWGFATVETFTVDFGDVDLQFDLFCLPFIGCQELDATLTDLHIEAVAPFGQTLDANGRTIFTNATLHATGLAHVTGLGGLVDETVVIDEIFAGEFNGRVTGSAGWTTFNELAIEPADVDVPAEELPDGVTALSIQMVTNLSNTVLEGPYDEIVYPLGDINLDRTVNLDDYVVLDACMSGPDSRLVPVGCSPDEFAAADLDDDGDVDLVDFSEFQGALGDM